MFPSGECSRLSIVRAVFSILLAWVLVPVVLSSNLRADTPQEEPQGALEGVATDPIEAIPEEDWLPSEDWGFVEILGTVTEELFPEGIESLEAAPGLPFTAPVADSLTLENLLDAVDVDGNGISTAGDRYIAKWWIDAGGKADLLLDAARTKGAVYDVSAFFAAAAASPELGGGGEMAMASQPTSYCEFIRGDADNDGIVDDSDLLYILNYLFASGPEPESFDAADANDSGSVNISDVVYLDDFLHAQGPAPLSPFPDAGVDPTIDLLEPQCDPYADGSVPPDLLSAILDECEDLTSPWGLCYTTKPDPPIADQAGTPYVREAVCAVLPQYQNLAVEDDEGNSPPLPDGEEAECAFMPQLVLTQGKDVGFLCPAHEELQGATSLFTYPVRAGSSPSQSAQWGTDRYEGGGIYDPCNVAAHAKYSRVVDENGVDISNGEFTFNVEYLKTPGRGLDYSFSLTYRSTPGAVGISSFVGLNWDHRFFDRLEPWLHCEEDFNYLFEASEFPDYVRGYQRIVEGRVEYYYLESPGFYLPANESHNRLRETVDEVVIRTPSGTTYHYYPLGTGDEGLQGHLKYIENSDGDRIRLNYEVIEMLSGGNTERIGRPVEVIDTYGRVFSYNYNDDDLLESVVDYLGREVRLTYAPPIPDEINCGEGSWPCSCTGASNYNGGAILLEEIQGPAVTEGPADNLFPNGKRFRFEYNARAHMFLFTVPLRTKHVVPSSFESRLAG